MFRPRGLALFGGVTTVVSFGQLVALSQIRYGYKGRLYPISQKGGEMAGLKVFKALEEVDGPVDLAAISVPARAVPQVLRQCLKYGVAGAQIHSSGFSETAESEGIALEAEIKEIARQGIRVVGPNCFGIHCPQGGITLLPGTDFSKQSGPFAMISQSGGVATDFGYEARRAGLAISKVVSFGNGCDLGAAELLDYLAHDPETQYIAAYLEGVQEGRLFMEVLQKTTVQKPVVIWKGGLSPLGSRAALSHTGSLGGAPEIWTAALRQAGAVGVQGLDQMMDTLVALKYLKTAGRRIALLGGGGAIGVFSSDLAHQWGLQIPTFGRETQRRLKEFFPAPGNSMANPLDTGTPALPLETLCTLAREVLTREPIDVLIVILLLRTLEREVPTFYRMNGLQPPPRGSYLEGLVGELSLLKQDMGKDVVMVFENRAHGPEDVAVEAISRKMRDRFQAQGIPVFARTEQALRGIGYASAARRRKGGKNLC
jgi:acyl-CoA synthetase (NDP forming)